MGHYTKNLFKRNKNKAPKPSTYKGEKLVECAIERDGVVHNGFKTHADLRRELGDEMYYSTRPGDTDGFMTSKGRFVDRYEARDVGEKAGQCMGGFHKLLSSDVTWP